MPRAHRRTPTATQDHPTAAALRPGGGASPPGTPTDLVFLHCRHTPECEGVVDKAFDYFTLQVMASGAVDLAYDAARHAMRGSWAWPCLPGPRIRFHAAGPEPWDHRYAAFAGRRAERWLASGLLSTEPQPVGEAALPAVLQSFDELIGRVAEGTPWSLRLAGNALERVLLLLAEARAVPLAADVPDRFRPLLEALADAEGPEPDLPTEARKLHLGVTTLRRHFKAATGLAPHAYRLHHRVLAARRLLTDTDLPLKEIADRLSYGDVHHFSRHFRSATGTPPARYRASR